MIMTQDKAFKAAIRARMAQSGEPYSVARRALLADEEAGAGAASPAQPPGPGADPLPDDYNARYAREAAAAGVPADEIDAELRSMAIDEETERAADRLRAAGRLAQQAADRAQRLAEQAEGDAEQAEERAHLAQEAADLASEWADPGEQQAAQARADRMQELADRARDRAEQARQAADNAQERAELAEAAAEAGDDDDGPGWDFPSAWTGQGMEARIGRFTDRLNRLTQRASDSLEQLSMKWDPPGQPWPPQPPWQPQAPQPPGPPRDPD
jgi:hypothetical protein